MKLRHIEVFHALMNASSMTEAAQRLHVSQPAVSMVLKHAEQTLRMKLFHRTGGRLTPTSEAHALLPEVEQIFRRLESLERSAQALREAAAGGVSVAAAPSVACNVLPALLGSFAQKRPRARIKLRVLHTSQVQASVLERRAELGLVFAPSLPLEDGLQATQAMTYGVMCVLPRQHRLASKLALTAQDLDSEPLVTFGTDYELGLHIAAAFAAAAARPDVRVESSSSMASVQLAAAGLGVALVDLPGMADAFPQLVELPFVPRIETRVLILQAADRPLSRIAAAFLRHTVETLGEEPASTGTT